MPKNSSSTEDKTVTEKTARREKVKKNSAESSELSMPRWAVISASGCLGCGITYQEAENIHVGKQDAGKTGNSNTIVTFEVAAKICSKNHPTVS